MKLQQLKYVEAIARSGLSISVAADVLHTSQPGVSKQLQLFEEELGLKIFERHGKRLISLTPIGKKVVEIAEQILLDVENIKQLAADNDNDQTGTLSIGTTHTQARYALPKAIKSFSQQHPKVHLNMVQGTPTDVAEMAATGKIDIAVATEGLDQFSALAVLPCYQWNRSIVVPPKHPLVNEPELTLTAISQYPLLTYAMGFTGRAQQDQAFLEKGLSPNVIFTATDADVIKTYVELELGVGIIASMAFDTIKDSPLVQLNADHLFLPSITHLGIRRGRYLRAYTYDFIELLAPSLTKQVVDNAIQH